MATRSEPALGVSGRIARYFQSAQITPLLALIALLLGVFAIEEPPDSDRQSDGDDAELETNRAQGAANVRIHEARF